MLIPMDVFQRAYQVATLVGTHAGLLSSQFIRIQLLKRALSMNLSGLVISEATIPRSATSSENGDPEEGIWYVDRNLVGGFLSGHPRAKSIRCTFRKDHMQLSCRRHRLRLLSTEVTGYQTWKRGKSDKLVSFDKGTLERLDTLEAYVSGTAAADHLNAIRIIKGYGALATNSFVLGAILDKSLKTTMFAPPRLPRIAVMTDATKVVASRHGAAVVFADGYAYQEVSENCYTQFPDKQLRSLIDGLQRGTPEICIPFGVFHEVISQLSSLVFDVGVRNTAVFECTGTQSKGKVTIKLRLPQGSTERTFKHTLQQDFQLQWPLRWTQHWVLNLPRDDINEVACYKTSVGSGFVAATSDGKRSYVLLVAGIET